MLIIVVLFIHNIKKSEAINLLKSPVLEDREYIYKNIALNFDLFKTFFKKKLFWFSIYKMVDIMDVYKSLNISIGVVMKNPEIVKSIPDHLKTKICASMQLKITFSIKICS